MSIVPLSGNIVITPVLPTDVDSTIAVRNYLLFGEYEGVLYAVVSVIELSSGLDAYSKLASSYPLICIEREPFEHLYHKFLELKTEKEIGAMRAEEGVEYDEEISLLEFLRNASDLLSGEESAPIIKFVNSLFYQAIKQRASDIHIETHEKRGEVRFRVDGALTKHIDLDHTIIALIISRIKVISNLDISEKRIPQDGRTQVTIAGKNLDIRVSVLPTYYGERVVMRILMQSHDIPSLTALGFDDKLTNRFSELLKHSHGMILVTGPTGSGKSTTLHSFMQQIASPEKNIITVEDPVEYNAENLNQIQVNTKVGLTFASGLRSILRQDPDVIMVGEIRDGETAQIAIQAALTGHLVLSTLHTNTATGAITRLADMGIEPFLISSSLIGVLAQRLVRKLCPECKEEQILSPALSLDLGLSEGIKVFKQKGCSSCSGTGYSGRQAIGEFFAMDDSIKGLLKNTTDDYEIRLFAKNNHLIDPLSDQLITLLLEGVTSVDEIIRVGVKDEQ